MRELYEKMLRGRKPLLEYVAYGVNNQPRLSETIPEKVNAFYKQWGVDKDGYYLVLGRYIPENNYEMMFKGFMKSNSNKKLLVITNYKTEIQKFHEHIRSSTGYESDSRIVMAGTLYDQVILHYVRQNAHGYIHGHSVGGTNPGLLEAMSETDVNILYNVSFNRYVGADSALYFDSADDLARIIDKVDKISFDEKNRLGNEARNRMNNLYSWKHIVDEYSRVIHEVVTDL